MKATAYLVAFLFLNFLSLAQEVRYETATGTNSVQIADFETGELISVLTTNSGDYSPFPAYVLVNKDNFTFKLRASASQSFQNSSYSLAMAGSGDTVRGTAMFFINPAYAYSAQGFTIKITPVSFPPNQTLIVPSGTNQVQVSLESSTNLVNWATTTNGVYGSPDAAYFFRMRMTKLQP
ncbi:MAG: hypothetical protein V9H26_12370 [Verrucomicrobiota bacterium]